MRSKKSRIIIAIILVVIMNSLFAFAMTENDYKASAVFNVNSDNKVRAVLSIRIPEASLEDTVLLILPFSYNKIYYDNEELLLTDSISGDMNIVSLILKKDVDLIEIECEDVQGVIVDLRNYYKLSIKRLHKNQIDSLNIPVNTIYEFDEITVKFGEGFIVNQPWSSNQIICHDVTEFPIKDFGEMYSIEFEIGEVDSGFDWMLLIYVVIASLNVLVGLIGTYRLDRKSQVNALRGFILLQSFSLLAGVFLCYRISLPYSKMIIPFIEIFICTIGLMFLMKCSPREILGIKTAKRKSTYDTSGVVETKALLEKE